MSKFKIGDSVRNINGKTGIITDIEYHGKFEAQKYYICYINEEKHYFREENLELYTPSIIAKDMINEQIIPKRIAISNLSMCIDMLNKTRNVVSSNTQKEKVFKAVDILTEIMMEEFSQEEIAIKKLETSFNPIGNEDI